MNNFLEESAVKNIKQIRETYELSVSDMAWLLQLKSKGSIYQMEKDIAYPSFAVLERLVFSFGISTDWFLGLSNQPYTEDAMCAAEDCLAAEFAATGLPWKSIIDDDTTAKIIPRQYADYEKRKQAYSLVVRSNIVLLMRMTWMKVFLNPDGDLKDYLIAILPKALQTDRRNRKAAKFMQSVEPLNNLLRIKGSEPLYDLGK